MTGWRFVLATANRDKAREIVEVLEATAAPIELVHRPHDVAAVAETGDTLEANARLKAETLVRATAMPAIAGDTGLEVDALGGAPGVRSARYAGPDATYAENVTQLLADLAASEGADRSACFVTVAVACWPDGREVMAFGDAKGSIAQEPRGSEGFGYDPVFVPAEGDGRTFAEMTATEKHGLSHRGRAFRTLAQRLRLEVLAEEKEEEGEVR